jgi:hypothetical protein
MFQALIVFLQKTKGSVKRRLYVILFTLPVKSSDYVCSLDLFDSAVLLIDSFDSVVSTDKLK